MDYEEVRKELVDQGVCAIQATSNDMWPMIKKETDILVFEAITQTSQLEKWDIVLYEKGGGQLAISRVHDTEGQEYILNSDNASQFARVYRRELLGRMTTYYRKGQERSLDDSSYQTYLYAWVYPISLRFGVRATIQFIRKFFRGFYRGLKLFFGK